MRTFLVVSVGDAECPHFLLQAMGEFWLRSHSINSLASYKKENLPFLYGPRAQASSGLTIGMAKIGCEATCQWASDRALSSGPSQAALRWQVNNLPMTVESCKTFSLCAKCEV